MIRFYTVALFSFIFITSCKTASKAYEQGNYYDAVELAIKKLQKDPHDPELKEILKTSYKYAIQQHEDKIRILSGSNSENKWAELYRQYSTMQELYNSLRQYPPALSIVQATDYSGYIETYKDKAAAMHYEKGLKWMNEGDKAAYREAYKEFKAAQRFKPDDFDIRKKAEEAYDAAMVKVLLMPVDAFNSNYYYSNSSYQLRNFQDQLIRNLNFHSGNNFVKYYSSRERRNNYSEPDEVLEMRLGRISIGQPYDQRQSRQVSKEVVTKEIVYKKDSVVKEYSKVYATITTTKRLLVSVGDLYVTSRDSRGRILWSDNFQGEHRWQTEFATYTGDERALSESDKALLNRRDNNPPREEDIVEEILRQMEKDLTHRLRNYYQRYQ